MRAQALFRDRFIAVVRDGHPLSKGRVTPARFASSRHAAVSRRGATGGPLDDGLQELGLVRDIAVVVTSFSTALALARSTDLVATVPERHTAALRSGLRAIRLPFPTPPIALSLLWHPRFEADAAHRWLRGLVREVAARGGSA